MFKKLWVRIKEELKTPKLDGVYPALSYGSPNDEVVRHSEMRNIELAKLQLEQNALQKNLVIMHRTMLATMLAVLVSIVLGLYAVTSKQDVIVTPNINIEVPK